MAKKKKSGRIAVPFLVTVFLGLLIVGGGAYAEYINISVSAMNRNSKNLLRELSLQLHMRTAILFSSFSMNPT